MDTWRILVNKQSDVRESIVLHGYNQRNHTLFPDGRSHKLYIFIAETGLSGINDRLSIVTCHLKTIYPVWNGKIYSPVNPIENSVLSKNNGLIFIKNVKVHIPTKADYL
jgi:hypothetical protein